MNFNSRTKIGLGTWRMGESAMTQSSEIEAIEHAVTIGYRLIDTAEMYANGQAETLIGKALKNLGPSARSSLTLVSKVLPSNASTHGVIKACEASLRRLGCEYLDLYLLHWKGSYTFEQTIEGFLKLKDRGLIKHHGVSNFDVSDLKKWSDTEKLMGLTPSESSTTNQVYYSLSARGIEFDLAPHLAREKISLMAYSPIDAGELMRNKGLGVLAASLNITAAQLALAWAVRHANTVAIPKSVSKSRIEENWASKDLSLSPQTLAALDNLFPPPCAKTRLAVI